MMLWITFFILCTLAFQAHSVELVPEDFSGEAEISAFTLTTQTADLLDGIENVGGEDIFTTIFNDSDVYTTQVESNTTLVDNGETTTPVEVITTKEPTTTTKFPITTTTVADTTVEISTTPISTTNAPTSTNAETTTTTMAPTTTTVPSTTTTIPTTTVKVTTKKPTTTTKSTTKMPTKPIKPILSTTTILPIPTTTEVFAFPDPQAPQCTFTDPDFFCDTEVVCFGEGKIDCTEEFEEIIPEITISKSTSESGSSHDFSDYEEAESETIGEFPPELVGRVSPKQRPFLFKMKELETATPSLSSDESDEDKSSSSTTKTTIHITIENGEKNSESSMSSETSTEPSTDSDSSSDSHDSATQTIIIRTETSSDSEDSSSSEMTTETSETSTSMSMTETTLADTTHAEKAVTKVEKAATHVDKAQVALPTNVTIIKTTVEDDVSAAIIEDSVETNTEKAHSRNKREENRILSSGSESSSSSMSISLRVAALEGSHQKMRVRRCRTTGTLYCSPTPTAANCRGRTLCQLLSSTAETSEKSTSAKGVENWAIAVIAICAIAAALTVSLLIYLVFTSWKKLKVQPHNGVTTLTYVNNTPP